MSSPTFSNWIKRFPAISSGYFSLQLFLDTTQHKSKTTLTQTSLKNALKHNTQILLERLTLKQTACSLKPLIARQEEEDNCFTAPWLWVSSIIQNHCLQRGVKRGQNNFATWWRIQRVCYRSINEKTDTGSKNGQRQAQLIPASFVLEEGSAKKWLLVTEHENKKIEVNTCIHTVLWTC